MQLPKHVKIVEVSPRDGLQNEAKLLSTAIKTSFIDQLSQTGLQVIEAGSFVSPRWVPQMADTAAVLQSIAKNTAIQYPVLVPNLQGFAAALKAGAEEIAVFTAASETFSQKNTHCSIAEGLLRIEEIIKLAQVHQIPVRAYISCVLGCPYEGVIDPHKVAKLAMQLFNKGCYEISLGDTIGTGTPVQAQTLIKLVAEKIPLKNIAVHFHDTYGQALANIFACLSLGVSTVDAAIGGLGGCPYAQGAAGNVATEDVIYMLQGLGIETGINLTKLIAVDRFICEYLGRPSRSKVALAAWGKR